MSFYLTFTLVNMALGGGFLASMLYVIQRSDIVLRISIEGSILNILLDLVLIPYFNEMGAVAATGSAMVYMSVRQWSALNATVDVRGSLPFIGRCFFFSLVAAAPFLLLSAMGWNHLILSFVAYALSLVLVLGWVKPLSEEHRTILAGIQPRLGDWARWFVR
jgi:O-antigen/teichoic acid export membrane protein